MEKKVEINQKETEGKMNESLIIWNHSRLFLLPPHDAQAEAHPIFLSVLRPTPAIAHCCRCSHHCD
jgi:hypothetical protein